MRTEPIRLPAVIVSILLLVVVPAATAVLEGAAWRTVALAALAVVPVLLGGAEAARAFTDSPATRQRQLESGVLLTATVEQVSPGYPPGDALG